jgi:hypothetical protein
MTPAPLPHFAVGASFSGLFGVVEPAHGLLFEDRAKTLYGLVP